MDFPKKREFCERHRNTSTQADDCQECSDLNIEKCTLCGKNLYAEASSSNNTIFEGNLPDVCQCFSGVGVTDLLNATIDARGSVQTTEQPVTKICDSVSNVQLKDDEISRSKETSNVTVEDLGGSNEESENLEISHSSNGYLSSLDELSSHQSFTSPKDTSPSSEEDSKRSNDVKSYCSSGYPLSLGDQSPEQNLSDNRDITSPSSGEESKNTERESSLDESENNTDSNKLSGEYLYSESSQSNENSTNNKRITEESDNKYSVKTNSSIKEKSGSVISPEGEKFVFNNPEIISKIRPSLPRPFPQASVHPQPPQLYQLFSQNSLFNMPIATPHPQFHHQPYSQPFQSYSNPIMNMPVVGKIVPGRFPVSSRPQLSTPYYQSPQHEGNKGLSKKLLAQVQTQQANLDQKNTKIERINDWLDEIEVSPPDNPPDDPAWAYGWSVASNEENEAIPPIFSGSSTDERSSTEISEEENRRQRLIRRPPRNTKRGKPK